VTVRRLPDRRTSLSPLQKWPLLEIRRSKDRRPKEFRSPKPKNSEFSYQFQSSAELRNLVILPVTRAMTA
jgi:hypothetical protein